MLLLCNAIQLTAGSQLSGIPRASDWLIITGPGSGCSAHRTASPIIILTAFTFDILIICVTSHDHCTVATSSISWTSPDSMMPSLSCLCWFFRRNKHNNYCVIITTTAPQKTGINKQFTLDDLFPNNSVYHLSPGIRQALPVTSGGSSHVKSQTRIK